MTKTIDSILAKAEQGNWKIACGGTETPFLSRSGKTLLYCWQPSAGRHAYLDCGSDIFLTDDEAQVALRLTVPLPVFADDNEAAEMLTLRKRN